MPSLHESRMYGLEGTRQALICPRGLRRRDTRSAMIGGKKPLDCEELAVNYKTRSRVARIEEKTLQLRYVNWASCSAMP